MIPLLLLATAITSAPDCAPAAIQQAVDAAAGKMQADPTGAKESITPVLSCPVNSSPAYYAHVLRADIAVRQSDWNAVRSALAGIGFHPESKISVRSAAIVLRTDVALNDMRAFADDRASILEGNDAMLSKIGKKIETFRTDTASVTAYEANVEQGVLHRVLEFIIVPDEPGAYPMSIELTDDVGAVAAQPAALKQINGAHAWFIDAYRCSEHRTLEAPVGASQPLYEIVKATVVKALNTGAKGISSFTQRDNGLCPDLNWILPGIGAKVPALSQ